jgi:hypothetical protein
MSKAQQQAAELAAQVTLLTGEMTAKCMVGEWEDARVLSWKLVDRVADYMAFTARQRDRSGLRRARRLPR